MNEEPELRSSSLGTFSYTTANMTLRDYYAGQALAGFMNSQGWLGYLDTPKQRQRLMATYARDAYDIADAMLAAREAK